MGKGWGPKGRGCTAIAQVYLRLRLLGRQLHAVVELVPTQRRRHHANNKNETTARNLPSILGMWGKNTIMSLVDAIRRYHALYRIFCPTTSIYYAIERGAANNRPVSHTPGRGNVTVIDVVVSFRKLVFTHSSDSQEK